jgi:hypothetical protein
MDQKATIGERNMHRLGRNFGLYPSVPRRLFMFTLLFTLGSAIVLLGAAPCLAAEGTSSMASAADSVTVKTQAQFSQTVQKLANSIDRFFGSDRYQTWETNESSIRLRLNFDYIEGQDINLNLNVQFNIFLPGISHRLSLVGNPDDDEGTDSGEDARNESELALRWMGGKIGKADSSYDLGLRIKDSNLAGFARWNLQRNFSREHSQWNTRLTNRLYWYTDTGFRDDFRFYIERPMRENLFFRARTRLQYFEEQGSNIFPEQRFTVYQRIGKSQILAYEALGEIIPDDDSAFDDDNIDVPDSKYTDYLVRVRYRTNWLHPWLFVEFWPTIAWPEEHDYRTTYAARLRLEIHFGYTRAKPIRIDE